MRLTYFLIDFENIQPSAADLSLIRGANYRVRLFHGTHQNKFDADTVKALQPLGIHAEYLQCERKGKNALDFHVSFYLGRLVQEHEVAVEPAKKQTRFVIISKDNGFDTLLRHVESLGYEAGRIESIADALAADKSQVKDDFATYHVDPVEKAVVMKPAAPTKKSPVTKTATANTAKPDTWQRTLAFLRDHPKNRPTNIKKLERHLETGLGNGTSPGDVKTIVSRLQQEGIVVETGKKIAYKIPKAKLVDNNVPRHKATT